MSFGDLDILIGLRDNRTSEPERNKGGVLPDVGGLSLIERSKAAGLLNGVNRGECRTRRLEPLIGAFVPTEVVASAGSGSLQSPSSSDISSGRADMLRIANDAGGIVRMKTNCRNLNESDYGPQTHSYAAICARSGVGGCPSS